MKNNSTFIVIFLLFLASCTAKNEKKVILIESNLEQQMIEAYKKGVKALEEGDVLYAAKNFNTTENLYPQSTWAPKSVIMSAYSYYSQDYYGDALFELDRFTKNYSGNKYSSYVQYLIAICHYERIQDEKKDIGPLLKSKKNFEDLIINYPDTDYSLDAKYKILVINNLLASKELYLAKYYLEREKWIPALKRLQTIVEVYDDTVYIEETLHRLVEINYKIGLEDESKKYAKLLGYNYLSSRWYKESYKILNKDYLDPIDQIKKSKSKKIIKNFKKLFN
jgi:outer membrane protein assembly factor BamD